MANGQLWEIDSQGNKKIISGMVTGELHKYEMAEYLALTDKPTDWICTDYDATSEYGINATEVKYDSNNSVKDMIDVKSINITNQSSGINYINAFRIGKLVVIEFGLYYATANTTLFTVEQSARPSSNISTSQWLPTDSSSYGTKTFTLNSSNGNVTCNNDVFRGTMWFIYTI